MCQGQRLVHLVTAEKPDLEKAWRKARGEASWIGENGWDVHSGRGTFLVRGSRARRAGQKQTARQKERRGPQVGKQVGKARRPQ